MAAYLARRVLSSIVLTWLVATLVFGLVELLPGRPFHAMAGPGTAPGTADVLRESFGSDLPAHTRYLRWLGDLARGELGTSLSRRAPVTDLLLQRVGNSIVLALVALGTQFGLGVAWGLLAARLRAGGVDRVVGAAASLLYAIPSYCTALLLVGLFAVRLRWLPASQMESADATMLDAAARWLDRARHLVLPTLALALPAAAGIALYVRDLVTSRIDLPFALAARARGVGADAVLVRHALRSSLLPLIQLLGLSLPGLVGGSVVVEVLFAWPGMGRLAYEAVMARDAPLVLGCTLVAGGAVILGSLVADLLAAVADPRLREAVR